MSENTLANFKIRSFEILIYISNFRCTCMFCAKVIDINIVKIKCNNNNNNNNNNNIKSGKWKVYIMGK